MSVDEIIKMKHAGDDEQLEFIFSDESKIIVSSPAGCGKTTAMVSKIARELCSGSVVGNKRILAMTYSVNAAIRIKDSLKELLPDIVDDPKALLNKVDIANYHNFAMRLLYKYGYVLNSNLSSLSGFRIVDDETILTEGLLTSADQIKFEIIEKSIRDAEYEGINKALDTYWNILNKLLNQNIITYNGILIAAIRLLSIENVAHFYGKYYQMIIIDEFQDTNLLGYLLVDRLVSNNRVVFLGDDVQKIYGFLGAMDDALRVASEKFNAKEITFKNNYRFKNNERMRQIDLLIRDYADNYQESSMEALLLVKKLKTDSDELTFISEGIRRILEVDSDVAVLVRAGWQGNSIVKRLEEEKISFFNALYTEADVEYTKFYNVAVEEFHNNVSGRAVQRTLQSCLKAIKSREHEVYSDASKKYIFDSLYKLLEKLFEVSRSWDGTSKERYINIDFNLENKGLKHMMENLDEKVILTTIHSSKGLEWDYVIIPQMNAAAFPSWKYMCKMCHDSYGCNEGYDYCINNFVPEMQKKFREEISAYYVAQKRKFLLL